MVRVLYALCKLDDLREPCLRSCMDFLQSLVIALPVNRREGVVVPAVALEEILSHCRSIRGIEKVLLKFVRHHGVANKEGGCSNRGRRNRGTRELAVTRHAQVAFRNGVAPLVKLIRQKFPPRCRPGGFLHVLRGDAKIHMHQ